MPVEPKIYLIVTDDKDGTNFHAFFTAEERDARFHQFCVDHWPYEDDEPVPADPYEAYETVSAGDFNYAYISDISFEEHPVFKALWSLLTDVIQSETDSDGDVILPLDRSTDLRARILGALGAPILRKDILHGFKLDRDSEGEPIVWENNYKCDCGEEWSDEWSCQCNDRCPSCNAEIEPHTSNWIGPEGEEVSELWFDATFETTAPTQKTAEQAA
ncbi:hypothetical protein [Phaeobacter piscinae]|uniref:hypothetical protein n=1 Tax=Phaeobacter piscinae TaxID=1580596 RepID=UPI00058F6803|nr:hypothetical protein [Phaeobacter piscinae]UTS82846.1 hypothetical protein OL67_003956 [Phaeobacter piscinae]